LPRPSDAEWISFEEAARIIGRSPAVLTRLIYLGHVRRERPTKGPNRYSRADALALAPSDPGPWLTLSQAARRLNCSTNYIYRFARRGRIRIHAPADLRPRYHAGDVEALRFTPYQEAG
jgi:excisionase family DNA binding protein